MNEQELRLLVRAAVERHLGSGAPPAAQPLAPHPSPRVSVHASHVLYTGLVNVGDACVIEPAVACDHCGYCKSHGH